MGHALGGGAERGKRRTTVRVVEVVYHFALQRRGVQGMGAGRQVGRDVC